MDYAKELLLTVATVLVSTGVTVIQTNIWSGAFLLLAGALIFIGRGFYKKYFNE
jgi:hypothetical protein